jgi:hypothetical protein
MIKDKSRESYSMKLKQAVWNDKSALVCFFIIIPEETPEQFEIIQGFCLS